MDSKSLPIENTETITAHMGSNRSDEGLTLETSAFLPFYGG